MFISLSKHIIKNMIFLITFLLISCINSSQKYYEIGVALPLSGDIASFGESTKRGIELALDEVNNLGGINGKSLKVIYEDTRCEGKLGVTSIKKFIEVDKVNIVIGGVCSSVALAMSTFANESLTPLVVPFASSPDLENAGEYIFKIMPSDAFQGVVAAQWMHDLGYKNIAVIFTNNAWGLGLKNAFIKESNNIGLVITTIQTTQEGQKDFRSELVNIKELNVDVIFAPTYPKEAGQMLKQAKDLGITLPVFGGDPWGGSKDLIETAGKAADEVFFTAPMQYEGKEFKEFAQKFKNRYGIEPDAPASAGFDALHIVSLVLNGEKLTGPEIQKALSNVKNFKGATGITTFDETGSVRTKTFAKMTVKNGEYLRFQ